MYNRGRCSEQSRGRHKFVGQFHWPRVHVWFSLYAPSMCFLYLKWYILEDTFRWNGKEIFKSQILCIKKENYSIQINFIPYAFQTKITYFWGKTLYQQDLPKNLLPDFVIVRCIKFLWFCWIAWLAFENKEVNFKIAPVSKLGVSPNIR